MLEWYERKILLAGWWLEAGGWCWSDVRKILLAGWRSQTANRVIHTDCLLRACCIVASLMLQVNLPVCYWGFSQDC